MAIKRNLVTVPCNFCGSRNHQVIATRSDGLRVVECHQCSLLFINPRPSDETINMLYGEDYFGASNRFSTYTEEYVRNAIWAAENVVLEETNSANYLRELEELLGHKGRVLDVGCAIGFFLRVARELGWETQGIEVSAYAARLAHEHFGLRVHVGTVADAPLAPGTFHAATMFDVIEHVTDPLETLGQVARLIKPGGALLVHTPNAANAGREGEDWLGFRVSLEHLYYFSASTLGRYLRSVGLEVTRTRSLAHTDLEWVLNRDSRLRALQRQLFRLPTLYRVVRGLWRRVNSEFKQRDEERGYGHTLEMIATKPLE